MDPAQQAAFRGANPGAAVTEADLLALLRGNGVRARDPVVRVGRAPRLQELERRGVSPAARAIAYTP